MKPIYIVMAILVSTSCNMNTANHAASHADTHNIAIDMTAKYAHNDMQNADSTKDAALKKLTIVNEYDPVCSMPLRRGFEDTAMYKGRLVAFVLKIAKMNL